MGDRMKNREEVWFDFFEKVKDKIGNFGLK